MLTSILKMTTENLERTCLCNRLARWGKCERSGCTYAHSREELRPRPCNFGATCYRKDDLDDPCFFIHLETESFDEYVTRISEEKWEALIEERMGIHGAKKSPKGGEVKNLVPTKIPFTLVKNGAKKIPGDAKIASRGLTFAEIAAAEANPYEILAAEKDGKVETDDRESSTSAEIAAIVAQELSEAGKVLPTKPDEGIPKFGIPRAETIEVPRLWKAEIVVTQPKPAVKPDLKKAPLKPSSDGSLQKSHGDSGLQILKRPLTVDLPETPGTEFDLTSFGRRSISWADETIGPARVLSVGSPSKAPAKDVRTDSLETRARSEPGQRLVLNDPSIVRVTEARTSSEVYFTQQIPEELPHPVNKRFEADPKRESPPIGNGSSHDNFHHHESSHANGRSSFRKPEASVYKETIHLMLNPNRAIKDQRVVEILEVARNDGKIVVFDWL